MCFSLLSLAEFESEEFYAPYPKLHDLPCHICIAGYAVLGMGKRFLKPQLCDFQWGMAGGTCTVGAFQLLTPQVSGNIKQACTWGSQFYRS